MQIKGEPCVSLFVGAALCVFACVRVSVLVCVGTLSSHLHSFLRPPFSTCCPTPLFHTPSISTRCPHVAHSLRDTHFHKSSHFSSPTTRHVDYHGVSPLVSCNVCVFRGFSLSHLKKVRRYLVQKNIAPRVGSCLRFFSPISAPVLSRRFCTRTHETPPTRWKRRRRLPSSCGTSFLHLS